MNEETIKNTLADLPVGGIRYFTTLNSTNEHAAEWLLNGAGDLSLVLAGEQTAGRGRMGRRWISSASKSLTFSMILTPTGVDAGTVPLYSPMGAVAVCSAIEELFHLDAQIKWPNDVLIGGKKVCGILAEAIWDSVQLRGIVLGIGINLARNSAPPGKDLIYSAAGVGDFIEPDPDPLRTLRAVIQQLIFWSGIIHSPDFMHYWHKHLAYKGQQVRIIQEEQTMMEGRLIGVARDGSLRIELESGTERQVTIGDVHLRPGGG